MGNEFTVILGQMLQLLGMMFIGFLVGRLGIMREESQKDFTKLLVQVLNPFVIVSSVFGKALTFSTSMIVLNFCLAGGMFLLLILASRPLARLLRVPSEERAAYQMMLIFPNVGFMGIALVRAIYGAEAVLLVSLYLLFYNILMYTVGVSLVSGRSNMNFKKMISPGTIACLIAVVLFLFQPKVPEIVTNFIDSMGNACVPMSMIAVGMIFSQIHLSTLLKYKRLLVFSLIKLLAIPLVCLAILKPIPLDSLSKGLFVLMIATPIGSLVPPITEEYGGDSSLSAAGVVLSTLLSAITLPIIGMLTKLV